MGIKINFGKISTPRDKIKKLIRDLVLLLKNLVTEESAAGVICLIMGKITPYIRKLS